MFNNHPLNHHNLSMKQLFCYSYYVYKENRLRETKHVISDKATSLSKL